MKETFVGLMCVLLVVDLVNRAKDPLSSRASVGLNLAVLAFGLAALLWS